MTRFAYPYRTPTSDSVVCSPWLLEMDGGELELPESLPDWDYDTDLHLTRDVTVDVPRVLRGAGLPDDARLSLAVVWESSGSRQRVQCFQTTIRETASVTASCHLVGADLGGTVSLTTLVVLAGDIAEPTPFAARLAGSILWSEVRSVRLSDDAPQFPIAVVDFEHGTNIPAGAAWYVQIGSNLHAAAMGSLLLYVNSANATASAAFRNAAAPTPVDSAVISAAYSDVARTLVERTLSDSEFSLDVEYPDESTGSMLQGLMQKLFPDQDLDDVARLRDSQPQMFASTVQAAVMIFGEG